MDLYINFILLTDDGVHPRFDEDGEPKVYFSTDLSLVAQLKASGDIETVNVYGEPGGPTLCSTGRGGGTGNGTPYP